MKYGAPSKASRPPYCFEKQLWSVHVGRQRSQAACKSVWFGCLDICSFPLQQVCPGLHTQEQILSGPLLVVVEFVSSHISNLQNISELSKVKFIQLNSWIKICKLCY